MTRHQYGISALVTQTSFREGSSGDLVKRRLFSQAIKKCKRQFLTVYDPIFIFLPYCLVNSDENRYQYVILALLNFTVCVYGLISLGLAFLVSKLGMILQASTISVLISTSLVIPELANFIWQGKISAH